MASNVSRGADAKNKTKAWLVERGYQVANLEEMRWIFKGGRPAFAVKQDQFGSDLLAMSGDALIFVQVKSGKACAGGTFPEARRKFAAFRFPALSRQLVIAWPPGASIPRMVEALPGMQWREVKAK